MPIYIKKTMLKLFKKKSKFEIDLATSHGDYTGGYNFLPWLLYMRPLETFSIFLNLFFGILAINAYVENGYETFTLVVSVYFGILIPALIFYLLRSEFQKKKKGISQ